MRDAEKDNEAKTETVIELQGARERGSEGETEETERKTLEGGERETERKETDRDRK